MHSFKQRGEGAYNAAVDLIGRNLDQGRAQKIALRDQNGTYSFGELGERIDRFANALRTLGIEPEQRIVLALFDSIDWPTAFLGAIKAGVVPIAVNTLLTPQDYAFIMADSRAVGLVVSAPLLPQFEAALAAQPNLKAVLVSGGEAGAHRAMAALMAAAGPVFRPAPTVADDICFWLYSSGTTGRPKGVVHLHSHLIRTAELYAVPVLGLRECDIVYSAAKLFFAYGLGNALTFPLAVGATTILYPARPTAEAVWKILAEEKPSVFYGVPTLYGMLLAYEKKPPVESLALRVAVSAGEALPAELGRRWKGLTGTDILDGIGSTEMLHIFISNRLDDLRYGTTGKPVPGYEVRLVDEEGRPVPPGELGDLQVKGPTSAIMYWNQRDRSRDTFHGWWTRSGDKYRLDEDGYYVYGGRTDDMLKVGGVYVSPFEVEAALLTHDAVLEAAVVGAEDHDGLIKPKAFVVLNSGFEASEDLAEALKSHVRSSLASFKYPRWVQFLKELPKTATGKIQRFKLRQQ